MYTNGSEEFNRLIETPNNKAIQKRLVFEDTEMVIDKFKTLIMYSSSNSQELQIGTTNMSYLNVEAFTDIALFDGQRLRLECGVELSDGSMEYAPMGVFTAVNTEKGLNSVKFTANDNMQKTEKLYTSSLTYPTTSDKIISEICEICEIELVTPIENPITVTEKLQGYTCREVLGFIAGIHGKFACFDRLGQLNLRWYSEIPIEKQNSLIWSFTKSQETFNVDKIEIAKNSETKFISGDGDNAIFHSNPLATQEITDNIFNELSGFEYSTGRIEMLDDIRLDVWDVIKISYLDGKTYFIPCMSIKQNMGASSTNIESFSKSKTQNQYRYEGATTQFLNRMATELLITNRVVANKVDTDYVDAQVGKINTLIFGSATGNVISTQFSNSVIAQLGDAQIKSAMIQDVSASKISAGTIYTNDVTIQSKNGQMMLKDNTIQISDGTRARVQIGKDASNDYSINVWDKDGKLMFSQGGITDAAIKDAIIRNDMVSENANIHAGKLDINSLFTEINGSSNTIKATKIYLDEQKQTLEASFRTMTTTVDGLKQTQTSQGTQITAIQGLINSKVWQQDITTAIDDINIGGRNLLLNSSEKRNTIINNAGTQQATDIYMYSEYGKKILHDGSVAQITVSLDYSTELTQGTLAVQSGYNKWYSFGHVSLADGQSGHLECTFDIPAGWLGSTNIGLRVIVDSFGEQTETVVVSNFKCEIGNKATSYTVAPEDTDSEIVTLTTKYSSLEQNMEGFKTTVSETYTTLDAFNNLSVGGRNLLLNSKTFSKATTQNQTNQALNIGIFSDYFMSKRAVGKQITVSFDWTTTATSGKFQILFNNTPWSTIFPNSTITISSSNKSGRVEYTATLTDAAVNSSALYTGLRIRIDNIEGTTTFSNVKCEFGNKATDWTPAPEETETVVTTLTTKYSTLEQDISGFKTTVSETYSTKTETKTVETIATQTANKFNWIVKNGTSATNFTLTDRMAKLTAEIISLNGNVKVNGDMLVAGAVTADKIDVTDLFTQNITVNGTFKANGSAWLSPAKEDLDLLRKSINGEITLTAAQKTAFDFDVNGKVDLFDFAICKASILRDLDILNNYPSYNPVNSNVNVTINPKNPKKIIDITATNSFGRNIDVFFGMDGINVPSVDTGLINCYTVQSQDDVIANYGTDNEIKLSELYGLNNMLKILANKTVTAASDGTITLTFDSSYAKKISRMGVMFVQINDNSNSHYGYVAVPYMNNASSWGVSGDNIFNLYGGNGGISSVKVTRSSTALTQTTIKIIPNVSATYASKTVNVRVFCLSLGME